MVKGMEYRSSSHRFQPGNEYAVLYRHRLGRANSYFPLTPFTVHVDQAHQTIKGRMLVIRRVDNAGRWENGSIGPLPVFDTLLSEVDDIESP
jgi:hypothetical protein